MRSKHIVLEILETWLCARSLILFISLVVLDFFLEVEWISSSKENIFNCCISTLRLTLFVTLFFAELISEHFVVFFFILIARFPFSITELFVLGLLLLINSDLDMGVGNVSGTCAAYN